MSDQTPPDSAEELNLLIARPMLAYLADTQGEDVRDEVLSRHDMGTTFWVYVPTQPTEWLRPDAGDEPIERVIRRVVTIRGDGVDLPDLYH